VDKKPAKKPAKKRGRPRIQLDERQVEALAQIQCTWAEMAVVLGCSETALRTNYAELIKKGRENGKTSLRRVQYTKAMEGNIGMLIWLGKQYLGQAEKREYSSDIRGEYKHTYDLSKLSDAELDALERAMRKAEQTVH
jgi:hypothetical protein